MERSENNLLEENSGINTDSISYKEQEWKVEHESILVEWADKAMCYRWLHAKSHQEFSNTNAWFTIPVIIMSTLTGTANFAQDKFPVSARSYAQMGIGAVNIFAGILTTIAQFLKVGELNEAHRVGSIAWDKFYRNIKVELAKSREERLHVSHMLKMCKEEFDRLMETSPTINQNIIIQFNKTFPTKSITDKNELAEINRPEIKRPEICDELVSTAEIVFIQNEENKDNHVAMLEMIKKKQKIMNNYEKELSDWVDKFEKMHNRKPLESEIMDNLQDTIKPDILNKLIRKIFTEIENNIDGENNTQDPLNNV